MTNQEAIKILNHISYHVKYDTVEDEVFISDNIYEAAELAIDALQQQLTDGWIPVSTDRLPEEMSQRVLVTLKNEMVLEVWYINKEFKYHEERPGGGLIKVSDYNPVIAWMPLPESWKGDANEQN